MPSNTLSSWRQKYLSFLLFYKESPSFLKGLTISILLMGLVIFYTSIFMLSSELSIEDVMPTILKFFLLLPTAYMLWCFVPLCRDNTAEMKRIKEMAKRLAKSSSEEENREIDWKEKVPLERRKPSTRKYRGVPVPIWEERASFCFGTILGLYLLVLSLTGVLYLFS